jgi:hypothetical protein
MEYRLKDKYGKYAISKRDVLSSAMYPKVGSVGRDLMTFSIWFDARGSRRSDL